MLEREGILRLNILFFMHDFCKLKHCLCKKQNKIFNNSASIHKRRLRLNCMEYLYWHASRGRTAAVAGRRRVALIIKLIIKQFAAFYECIHH